MMKNIINSTLKQNPKSHKGDNGKLLIIGGSKKYYGAPKFSILSARRFVDLIYCYPGQIDPYLINSIAYIPEAIVVHNLWKCQEVDCVLFGVGLGESNLEYTDSKVSNVNLVLKNSKKLVIDGDGLGKVKGKIPKGCILTPHEGEFKELFGIKGTKENVVKMAKKYSCTILKKDPNGDIISNGVKTKIVKGGNSGLTKGGTGDCLSGLVAALYCTNRAFESCVVASYLVKKAADRLKKKFGLNYSASDLSDEIARVK